MSHVKDRSTQSHNLLARILSGGSSHAKKNAVAEIHPLGRAAGGDIPAAGTGGLITWHRNRLSGAMMAEKDHTLQELSELLHEQQEQFAADIENASETGTLLFTLIKHFQEKSESLTADITQLRDALQTLASNKAVGPHAIAPNTLEGKEILARIEHARAALKGNRREGSGQTTTGTPDTSRYVPLDLEKEYSGSAIDTGLIRLLKKIEAAGWHKLQGGRFDVWATLSQAQSELIAQKTAIEQLQREMEELRPFKAAIERLTEEDASSTDGQED